MSTQSKKRRRIARCAPNNLKAFVNTRACDLDDDHELYWIYGVWEFDESGVTPSDHFCLKCGEAKIEELERLYPDKCAEFEVSLVAGYGDELDRLPFCNSCFVTLKAYPTEYALEEELNHFLRSPPTSPRHWAELEWALDAIFTGDYDAPVYGHETIEHQGTWRHLARIVRRAQKAKQ